MLHRRRNPYAETLYPTLRALTSGALRAWVDAHAKDIRRVIASLEHRPTLDVSDGIVLRDTDRAKNDIIKGSPVRFMWSRNQGFWFVPRSKDRRVDDYTVRRLTEYFAQAGMPVRVVGMGERAEEEGVSLASATGPNLADVTTRATGQVAAATFERHDLYFQRYEEPARKVLAYLPLGFRVDRRESKYGQIYIFLDSEDRLLTRSDYARFGATEKEAEAIAAERSEVEARQAVDREREASAQANLLERARNWRSPDGTGRRIYEVTSGQYRDLMGIHRPWIAEISPMQYGRMSDRAKRAYDEKRRQEWGASAEGAAQWQRMVEALALAGDIDLKTPGMFDEARGVVALIDRRRVEQAEEAARVERERRRELAETAATQATERMLSATERIDEIRNLVSRGVKRETGALSTGGGMIRYPHDGIASVQVTTRGWTVNPDPYRHGRGKSVSGTFTDADSPEAVASAIFAVLRQLFPCTESVSYLEEAKKAKRVFGAKEKTGTEEVFLTFDTPSGEVSITLVVRDDGYRVYNGRWYSHHSERPPIVEVVDKPAEAALREAAQRTRVWLARVVEAMGEVNRLKADHDALRSDYTIGGPRQLKYKEWEAAKERLAQVARSPA